MYEYLGGPLEDEATTTQPNLGWRAAICNWLFGELPEIDESGTIAESAGESYDPPAIDRSNVRNAKTVISNQLYNKSTISIMQPVAQSVCPSTIVARLVEKQRKSAPSPTSVDKHPLDDDARARAKAEDAHTEQTETLPLVMLALSFMYHEMITQGHWNADFFRGRRPPPPPAPATWKRARSQPEPKGEVRTLATTHLAHPCIDGWNVIIGALELARAWGMRDGLSPLVDHERGDYDLPLWLRMRLACCLIFSWKFHRSNYTCYPRRFYGDVEPTLLEPHTEELAHVAYAFLTINEQTQFGEWNETNAQAIRRLYNEMLLLEVHLLTSVSTFPLLAENVQVHAEDRLDVLFQRGVRSARHVMALRSIVPFFVNATAGRLYEELCEAPKPVAGGALVCAAFLCASMPASGNALFVHSARGCTVLFAQEEIIWALRILNAAVLPERIPSQLMALGAYGDPTWPPRRFLTPETLQAAVTAAVKLIV